MRDCDPVLVLQALRQLSMKSWWSIHNGPWTLNQDGLYRCQTGHVIMRMLPNSKNVIAMINCNVMLCQQWASSSVELQKAMTIEHASYKSNSKNLWQIAEAFVIITASFKCNHNSLLALQALQSCKCNNDNTTLWIVTSDCNLIGFMSCKSNHHKCWSIVMTMTSAKQKSTVMVIADDFGQKT